METNIIYHQDCLEGMPEKIPDNSIDMILADLPYGTTACKWDSIIPLEPLWEQYKRIVKDDTAIVLTASQPFTTKLISSNMDWFKYEWIWIKSKASNFQNARKMPMKRHENICVFYKKPPTYNQELKELDEPIKNSRENKGANLGHCVDKGDYYQTETGFNTSDIYFKSVGNNESTKHPTQKPISLFKFLIKTYTNEGDVVLDNVIGSGTTAVAAKALGREYIGFEKNEEYYQIAQERVSEVQQELLTQQ